jgi:hypothetical protein
MLKISNATECTDEEEEAEGHNYAENIERTAMDGGKNGAQGFPLSVYYCTTLQALLT